MGWLGGAQRLIYTGGGCPTMGGQLMLGRRRGERPSSERVQSLRGTIVMTTSYDIAFDTDEWADHLMRLASLVSSDTNPEASQLVAGGVGGVVARLWGVRTHYYRLHEWVPGESGLPPVIDYHMSSLFFHMDSALECFVFALNALGCQIWPEQFWKVTELQEVDPKRIANKRGYTEHFGSVVKFWQAKSKLLKAVMDNHDVSKHRTTIFRVGQMRQDAPPGFQRSGMPPAETLWLNPTPKDPPTEEPPTDITKGKSLETLVSEYRVFVNETLRLAQNDAERNIRSRFPE